MEPFRKYKNNSEGNSKYNSNMHSTMLNIIHCPRLLNIPLISCDDVVFNSVVKPEFVHDTDRNNHNQYLQMGAKREKMNAIRRN
ncbi:unnamed protein product [Macrosiphum euphorbiae]|uniref:Uncharacterized protein n=1 Tax=Macrosiphum euphorbiae TaxID=13131 RepID=A0AAV0YDB1_9HEMI|nr:unnamed protein product [Macrosiphum euphorbiae]